MSVFTHIKYFIAYILPYPDFKKGLPFTNTVFILFNLFNLTICLPSLIWLCDRFIIYKLTNCFIFYTFTNALWDRSSYFNELNILSATSSLSMYVIPFPKNDSLWEVIRWLEFQHRDRGYLSLDLMLVFMIIVYYVCLV